MTHHSLTGSLIQVFRGYRVPKDHHSLVDYITNMDIPDDADDALMGAYGMLMVVQLRSAYAIERGTIASLANSMAERIRKEGEIHRSVVDDLTDLFTAAHRSRTRVQARIIDHALHVVGMRIH